MTHSDFDLESLVNLEQTFALFPLFLQNLKHFSTASTTRAIKTALLMAAFMDSSKVAPLAEKKDSKCGKSSGSTKASPSCGNQYTSSNLGLTSELPSITNPPFIAVDQPCHSSHQAPFGPHLPIPPR